MSGVEVKEEVSEQHEEEGWEDAEEAEDEGEQQPGEEEEEEEEEAEEGEEEEEEPAEGEQTAAGAAGGASPSARCAMCGMGSDVTFALGELLQFDCTHGKKAGTAHVHLACAAWAPRAYGVEGPQPGAQHGLAMVPEEVRRARQLRCKQCGKGGAAMGCEVRSCKETLHLPCAMLQDGTRFDCERWQLFCPNHAAKCLGQETEDFQQRRRSLVRRLRTSQLPGAAGSTPAAAKTASKRPSASPAGGAAAAAAAAAAGVGSFGAAPKKGTVSPSGMGGSSRAPPAARHAPEPPLGAKRQRTGEKAAAPAGPVTSEPQQPQPLTTAARKPAAAGGSGRAGNSGSAPQAVGAAPVGGLLPAGAQQQQQQQQQGEAAKLPPAVRALLQEVFGQVLPGTIPAAEAYLWAEGVRSFSDLRFVDHGDFWAQVQPCTRTLFNKLFVLVQERDPAASVAAAAAAAAAAAGAAAAADIKAAHLSGA